MGGDEVINPCMVGLNCPFRLCNSEGDWCSHPIPAGGVEQYEESHFWEPLNMFLIGENDCPLIEPDSLMDWLCSLNKGDIPSFKRVLEEIVEETQIEKLIDPYYVELYKKKKLEEIMKVREE